MPKKVIAPPCPPKYKGVTLMSPSTNVDEIAAYAARMRDNQIRRQSVVQLPHVSGGTTRPADRVTARPSGRRRGESFMSYFV